MAKLVPSIEEINQLPTPLTAGESALMNALLGILDDDWTVYVQPFLNGLQPDIIIFSEQAGLGIFEVKDWNLDNYRVLANGTWKVFDGRQHRWHASKSRCPLGQVQRYKDNIIRYELPELEAEIILNEKIYGVVVPFVYFHEHTTAEVKAKIKPIEANNAYVAIFGHDSLERKKLEKLLLSQKLVKGSYFSDMMQDYQLQNRIRNSLAYPEHGRIDVSDIDFPLTSRQQELMPNKPGTRRVIGAAGSGKSLILARKAVEAAANGKKVLVVCYNITMANYLNDVVRRLARSQESVGKQISNRIIVRHYNRLFPGNQGLAEDEEEFPPFDVILIDEGQDFERAWIEQLYTLGNPSGCHIMFVEDDRQNIYSTNTNARRSVPGILGRPYQLKRTFRLNREVATLANKLIELSNRTFESEDVESQPISRQAELFPTPKPIWFDGTKEEMLALLKSEIDRLANAAGTGAFPDIVILVCTVEDGWEVGDLLRELRRPYICAFERRSEGEQVRSRYSGESVDWKLYQLRRGRKVAFRMQTGRIKICTIHSFKGWELKRVLVYFRPAVNEQFDERIPLLYTALTRAQEFLTVFNVEPSLSYFGQKAGEQDLLHYHSNELPQNDPQPKPLGVNTDG